MKTRPQEPIPTAFPTCGEVFHFLITALDLSAWADFFHDPEDRTKRRDATEIKSISDQLRDWATEAEGRCPTRQELQEFIRRQLHSLPRTKELEFVLTVAWEKILAGHAAAVRTNTTYLNRDETRVWYSLWQAPELFHQLWAFQKNLQRLDSSRGPMLFAPLNELLSQIWLAPTGDQRPPKHPLHLICCRVYQKNYAAPDFLVDPKTLAAWRDGKDRPSFDALGRHFSAYPDKLGMLLNFAFAGLLEAVAHLQSGEAKPVEWSNDRQLLLGQAQCVHCLDAKVAAELGRTPDLSWPDYERLLLACLVHYGQFLKELVQSGPAALDLKVIRFRVYKEYEQRMAQFMPPTDFGDFQNRLNVLWKGTALKSPQLKASAVANELKMMRTEHPNWCQALAGQLLAIEARLALCHEPPTRDSLLNAFTLYRAAFEKCRYQAGVITTRIAREALGLAAMLHRHETGEGAIKPWIKKVLAWWDLLGLGAEFDHEQFEQRIERAESRFTDELNLGLRDRLKSSLPQLGLNHIGIGGMTTFTELGFTEQLLATPIDRRQKKPLTDTVVGRDQTPLMEAIDRGQLDFARELVRKDADLNFINSTGDTCITKAFAQKYYDLVLEILRRDHNPIRRDVLLRVTNKMRISGLEQTLSHGQVEILREMAVGKSGRREEINMSEERIWNQTPLYYAVNCLALFRAGPAEAADRFPGLAASVAQIIQPATVAAVHQYLGKDHNPAGVLKCIDCLITELQVDLDVPNTYDNTALTLAAEVRMHEVVTKLLTAGANVNHRFHGGGTALVRAIINNDYEMARLLLESGADHRLFVDALGRPIYLMNMSEKMRRLIPDRL